MCALSTLHPSPVNKIGTVGSQSHKQLPSVFVAVCRSQWAWLEPVRTAALKRNTVEKTNKHLNMGELIYAARSLLSLSWFLSTRSVPPSLPVNEWFISLNCCGWLVWSRDHNKTGCDKYTLKIKTWRNSEARRSRHVCSMQMQVGTDKNRKRQ